MKKILVRILAMALAMMTVFSLSIPVLADGNISQKSDADGDCKKTFYVKTDGYILTKKMAMTMTKGNLAAMFNNIQAATWNGVPDSYEITIWYWNASTKKWVQEDNYDIYCKTSASIKLKKTNTYYKILVDSYGVTTTVKSYASKGKIQAVSDMSSYTYKWSKLPSWKIAGGSHCTIYTTNPVQ